MSNYQKIHKEALTKKGLKTFNFLKDLNFINNFYLAGGTGLALQIGHRISVDFDFFSSKKIDEDFLSRLEKQVNDKVKVSINNIGELTVFINEVKISFIHYPFPILNDLNELKRIKALPIKEIAATKAYTIGRRGEYKDYVDLYFLLKDKYIDLNELIELANKKYKEKFNGKLFLEQLLYREDVEEVELRGLKEDISKDKVFSYFEKIVSDFSLN